MAKLEKLLKQAACILRGMGYKTGISAKGAYRSKAIIASPDGLGLQAPKIVVEVKYRTAGMSSPCQYAVSWATSAHRKWPLRTYGRLFQRSPL